MLICHISYFYTSKDRSYNNHESPIFLNPLTLKKRKRYEFEGILYTVVHLGSGIWRYK